MHSHHISPTESPLRKRKRIFEYDTMDHCQQHQQEQQLIHDQVIVSKYDNAIITAPDTIATITETTTESSQSSHGDSSTFRTMEIILPFALPSIVTCAKGQSCHDFQERRTSHLDMMRYYNDSREISSSSVSYWVSPEHHVLCGGYRRQDDDDNLLLMHQEYDDCRQDLGFLDTNHPAVVTPRKGEVENTSSDTDDDDAGDWDCDFGRGSIKDFDTALKYNAHVAISNAEWMHRVVEDVRMDCSYSDYDCDCEDLDEYGVISDYGTEEEEEEEMLSVEQEEDASSGSSLMYDETMTLRYNFVKVDDFYKERRTNIIEQQEYLSDETVLDDVCNQKETSYNDIQQDNYTQMIEYEREFIVTQIEPACNEMKNIVDSFVGQGLGLGLGLGQSMQCDCIDYDSTQENRWYAQISSNVHGIYYYQPSTGAISRTEPFSYMDTSKVRCLDDNYYHGGMMSGEKELKYLEPIAIDYDFVKLVSPMRQRLTTAGKYKVKKNATLKNVRLFFIWPVLMAIIAVFSQRCGFGTKNTDAMTTKSLLQGELLDFSPHQCLPLVGEMDTCPLL